MADSEPDVRDWLVGRLRFAARFLLGGLLLGGLGVLALVATGASVRHASDLVFSLGTLVFGFGTLGWSGSVMLGRTVERAIDRFDANSDWTEADSRRAMVVLGSLGLGGMLGTVVVTSALWSL